MRLLLLTALLFASLTTGRANFEEQPPEQHLVRRLEAPSIVDPRNETLELRCIYDLHNKELYSVNWYKNGGMLFRYLPSVAPKGTAFPDNTGVNVSIEHSNGERLLLLGHQDFQKNFQAYRGTYWCEVSTEQPFHTGYAVANVSVAILPKYHPILEGVALNYQAGEQLDATCISAPSLPPAELAFYLNGEKVDPAFTHREKSIPINDVTVTTRLSISLRLQRDDFPGGSLSLTCKATLPGIDWVYKTEKIAALAARNQPLAQEPPKLRSGFGVLRPSDLSLVFTLFSIVASGLAIF